MPVFEYKALNNQGKTIKGIVDADGSAAARGKLRSQGLHPIDITDASQKKRARSRLTLNRFKSSDLALFMRQFATLIDSGLPLVESLNALTEQTENPSLKKIITELRERVTEGHALSSAMGEHSRVFSDLQVNMIRAGEKSGGLDVVLQRLADLMESRMELIQRVRSALTYPTFMLIIGTAVLFFLISFVVPKVTMIFQETGQSLPAATVILISTASFMQKMWWLIVIIFGMCVFFAVKFSRTQQGRHVKDTLSLRLPMWGSLQIKLIVARFSRTLGYASSQWGVFVAILGYLSGSGRQYDIRTDN